MPSAGEAEADEPEDDEADADAGADEDEGICNLGDGSPGLRDF